MEPTVTLSLNRYDEMKDTMYVLSSRLDELEKINNTLKHDLSVMLKLYLRQSNDPSYYNSLRDYVTNDVIQSTSITYREISDAFNAMKKDNETDEE